MLSCRVYMGNDECDSDVHDDNDVYMNTIMNKSISTDEYFSKENYCQWIKKRQERALSEYYNSKVEIIK